MRLNLLNIDEMFDPSALVTSHEGVLKNNKLNPEGIYSERIFGRLDQESVQYSCGCGQTRGHFNVDEECSQCKTKVVSTEPTISKMGWIDIGPYPIINPNFYRLLARLAPKALPKMVSFEAKLSRDGEIEESEMGPYDNIGLVEFHERFEECLEYLTSESKLSVQQREELIDLVTVNRDKVFITKIPIFTPALRPAIMINDAFVTDELNNFLGQIVHTSNQIKEASDEELTQMFLLPLLSCLQDLANQLFEGVINKVKGKSGFIRNNVMSNRLNFSCRCVITPLPSGYELDDIVLPYLAFMELYRFHLINVIGRLKGCSIGEADHIWNRALVKSDPFMIRVINELVKKTNGGLRVLLNRNPTISFGSILLLRIAGIKDDYNDYTASIHNLTLKPLGGDYDGFDGYYFA
jgi:DNA-directed RNA polymerase beta' subunit